MGCAHLDGVRDVGANTNGGGECLKPGGGWVHSRMRLVCGHIGGCDSSKNRYATKHLHATARSIEPGES